MLICSCSHIKPLNKKRNYYNSDPEIDQSLERIENSELAYPDENSNRQQVLDYYYQLRMQELKGEQSDNGKRLKSRHPRPRKKLITPRPKKIVKKRRIKRKSRGRKIRVNPEENKIRMEQILSYHCIKHRQENCKMRTARARQKCEENYDNDDQRLIRCIEKALAR